MRIGRLTLQFLALSNDMESRDAGGEKNFCDFLELGMEKENSSEHLSRNTHQTALPLG